MANAMEMFLFLVQLAAPLFCYSLQRGQAVRVTVQSSLDANVLIPKQLRDRQI
jgi:hypothetical protein